MERSAINLQKQIKQNHIVQNNSYSNPEDDQVFQKFTSNKFIPFLNQRDSIGRLIKNSPINKNYGINQTQNIKKHNLSIKRSASLQPFNNIHGLQSSLNTFFKENCVYKKCSPQKQKLKIHKKPSLQDFMIKTPHNMRVHLKENLNQVLQSNQQFRENNLGASQSLELKRFDQISVIKKQRPLQKKYSLALNMKPNSSNTVRKLSKNSLTLKIQKLPQNASRVYNLQKIKGLKGIDLQLKNVKGKVSECQELQRYREMKKLGMHLFDDINENHYLFLKKIQDTKQLAYKIRQGLQS